VLGRPCHGIGHDGNVIRRCVPTSSTGTYHGEHHGEEDQAHRGTARGQDYRFSVGDGPQDALAALGRGGAPARASLPGAAGGVGDHAGSAAAVAGDRGLGRTPGMPFLRNAWSFYRKLPKALALISLVPILLGVIVLSANQILGFIQSWEYLRALSHAHPTMVQFISGRYLAVTLVVSGFTSLALIFLWAAFLHDERYNALEKQYNDLAVTHPSLRALTLYESHGALLVLIKNFGAPATVWAKLSVSGSTLKPRSNVYAAWKVAAPTAHEVTIGSGDTQEIVLARTGSGGSAGAGPFEFYYWVPFIENGVRDETRAKAASWPNDPKPDPNPEARQDVRVQVFSDKKTSWNPPIDISLTLIGCDYWREKDKYVIGAVGQGPRLEDSPWDAFHFVGSELVAQFGRVLGAMPPSTEGWQTFKRLANKALSLADNLPDAARDQVRALVYPLLAVDQANLDSCSPVVTDLRTFLDNRPPWATDS
jgi:hypothetical protein